MHKEFYDGIKEILSTARNKVYQTANFAMVEAYWQIGKSIIEEQGGDERAEYGVGLLKDLSKQMTQDFGKGFTVSNLKNMRQFYQTFPNSYALRSELSWTHYNLLLRVENETQVFASKYKLYLPSEEELLNELKQEMQIFEIDKSDEDGE
jgi:hypothetical protein